MMNYRIAETQDAPSIAHLVNSAYRGDFSKEGWTTEADLLGGQRTDVESIEKTISVPGTVILLLYREKEIENELLACVLLENRANSVKSAYLGMLTVRPNLQSGGIGKQMLAVAEKWVNDNWNVSKIEMKVIRQRSELIAWYERRGYKNTGRAEPFPYGDDKFGIPKVSNLEFTVLEKNFIAER